MGCLDENTVAELFDGVLDDATRTRVEAHLDDCARCRALVGALGAETGLSTEAGVGSAPSRETLGRGTAVGRFVILEPVGAGSMGVVYAAYDPELDRRVALKMLRTAPESGEEVRERVRREAQSMARLSHPNIVAIHDVVDDTGRFFIAMEYISGQTLRDWLGEDRTVSEILGAFVQAGEGVVAAHAAGVVHRDFKPDNVLVSQDGRVRVTDFGLAALYSLTSAGRSSGESFADQGATSVVGTPRYMAPEQLRGERADPRSDQFSFCVALHEALYGLPPFAGDSMNALVAEVEAGQVRQPPRQSAVPAALRRAIVRGLAPDPDDRYPEMAELLAALRVRPRFTRFRVMALSAVGLAVVGGGIVLARSAEDLCPRVELDDVWNVRAKQALASAIESWPDRDDLVARVSEELDDYANGWTRMHEDACQATRVRRTQTEGALERRMACLEERRREFQALVTVLSELSPAAAPNAVDAARRLVPVARCARPAALKAGPGSDSPSVALSEELARVKALVDAGEFALAGPLANKAIERAETEDSPRGRASAAIALAWVQANVGEMEGAEANLHRALLDAEATGAADLRTEAMALLTFVVGYGAARHAEGLRFGAQAQALASRVDAPAVRQAQIWRYRGLVHHEEGAFDRAAAAHHRALETLADAGLERHPETAKTTVALANSHRALRQFDQAEAEYRRAIEMERDALGQRHPRVANALHGLGDVILDQKRPGEAARLFEQALEIHMYAFGPKHVDVAGDHLAMAQTRIAQGELGAADSELRAALEILDAAALREHPRRAVALSTLAHLRFLEGRNEEALELELASIALRRRVTPDHPDVAVSLYNVGINLLESGRAEQSVQHFLEATQMARRSLGPSHNLVASSLTGLGRALAATEKPLEAAQKLEEALQIWKDTTAHPRDRFDARFALARVLWAQGRERPRALELAHVALDDYAATDDPDSNRLDQARRWLSAH